MPLEVNQRQPGEGRLRQLQDDESDQSDQHRVSKRDGQNRGFPAALIG